MIVDVNNYVIITSVLHVVN